MRLSWMRVSSIIWSPALIAQDGDYVLMEEGALCAHEGVDPLTRRGLDKLMMRGRVTIRWRASMSPAISSFIPISCPSPARPPIRRWRAKAGRLTIDTPDDLAFVEAMHDRIAGPRRAKRRWPICFCCWSASRNCAPSTRHVKQKQLRPSGGLALIRCDGGGKFRLWPCQAHGGAGARCFGTAKASASCSRSMAARMPPRPSAAPASAWR